MIDPKEFEQAEAQEFDSARPTGGGYTMVIKRAVDTLSESKNRPMMVLLCDIATGPFKGHFKRVFERMLKKNPDAKWPCIYRQCQDGDSLPYFKGMITAIERSNPGYTFGFTDTELNGKYIGMILGEKEINEKGHTILEPRYTCSTESLKSGTVKIPPITRFMGDGGWGESNSNEPLPEYNGPTEEDLPF